MCAVLRGCEKKVAHGNPAGQGFHTLIGNKGGGGGTLRDENVLQSSAQCVPVFRYASTLIATPQGREVRLLSTRLIPNQGALRCLPIHNASPHSTPSL
jgi:hypothetical protein